jgi:hypothetical protein
MKNSTYRRRREHGIDVEEVRHRREDGLGLGVQERPPGESGPPWRAGSMSAFLRICYTVDDARLCPRPASSSWMPGTQPGLSRAHLQH